MTTRASHGHRATVVAVVVLLAAAAVGAARTKNECHSGDKAALLAIKSAFGNASYFQSWTSDYPCCDWINVFCDGSASPYTARRVVAVSFLRDASLVGPLPGAAIARLTALQQLFAVHVPGVNGTIPRDLSRLPNLNCIDISYTGVSGPVPAFLSKLAALTYLRLSFNALAGPIPASLGDIPNLSFLDLGRNRLTGAIPPLLLSKTRDTAYLSLSHNGLSGGVPAEFAAVKFWSLVPVRREQVAGDAEPVAQRVQLQPLRRGAAVAAGRLGHQPQRDLRRPPAAGGQPGVLKRQLQPPQRRRAQRRQHGHL